MQLFLRWTNEFRPSGFETEEKQLHRWEAVALRMQDHGIGEVCCGVGSWWRWGAGRLGRGLHDEREDMDRDAVLAFVADEFSIEPDFPWMHHPDYAVLRHADTGKWFALVMDVPAEKLGLAGDAVHEVMNIKVDPDELDALLDGGGVLPAYHMHKGSWASVLLGDAEDALDAAEVQCLIRASFALTPGW